MMIEQIENRKSIYQTSLEDPRWKRLRLQILDRDQHQCKFCGAKKDLQIHHRQYHRDKLTGEWLKSWEYHPSLLITVCQTCHYQGHLQYPIPTKEI